MEIGISTATYFGKVLTEDTFRYIKSAGVDVAEVFMTTFSEYTPEFGDILKKNAEDNGVTVYSVHSANLNYEPGLNNPVQRAVDDAEYFYREVLANGLKLNAHSYTYHGSTRLKRRAYSFDFEKLGAKMEHLCDIADEYNINLSYETVHWAYFNSPDFFNSLKVFSPRLKCTMDIKQIMQAGKSFEEFMPCVEGRLNNVHLTDYDGNGNILRPGKGNVDYYKLFSMLRDVGYDGPLMVELYCGNYDNYAELSDSVDYLKNILEKVK